MIRRPCISERSALFKIWSVCFGENESYISFFLDNEFDPANCFVWNESGKPVAVLYVFFTDFVTENKIEPIMYIYAAATLPEFRGRGIMSRLIDAAAAYAASQGCIFTFLLPGSDSLYRYYSKLGFEAAFKIKKVVLNRELLEKTMISNLSQDNETAVGSHNAIDIEKIYTRRIEFFKPAVQWRKKELSYALVEWQLTGGDILYFDDGYALCSELDGDVLIKEACGNLSKISSLLLSRYDSDSFTFMLPSYANLPFDTHIVNYGMVRLLNPDFQNRICALNSYANLMLD